MFVFFDVVASGRPHEADGISVSLGHVDADLEVFSSH